MPGSARAAAPTATAPPPPPPQGRGFQECPRAADTTGDHHGADVKEPRRIEERASDGGARLLVHGGAPERRWRCHPGRAGRRVDLVDHGRRTAQDDPAGRGEPCLGDHRFRRPMFPFDREMPDSGLRARLIPSSDEESTRPDE
ncbi:hypothetical protein [Streptomyces sviceus]|uniref:hypothetical protein n=1 Tax=Streptomyces sviceus TaxID=285530 RepID=UPI0036EA7836